MDLSGYRISITYVQDCTCFQEDEEFDCSGRALIFSSPTRFCLGFAENLIPSLTNMINLDAVAMEFDCSGGRAGCDGQMTYRIEKTKMSPDKLNNDVGGKNFSAISKLLMTLPMFKSFDQNGIIRLLSHFRFEHIHDLGFKSFRHGDTILKKGQPGTHLYIIIAGSIEVVDDNHNVIAILGKGEVFGEMSLISGKPVGATIRAIAPTTVFRLDSKDFNRILPKFPMLQFYFTCLLTNRLTKSNVERSQDLSAGMSGKLSDLPPEEVLQTLHFNVKTGTLNFQLSKGHAVVYFRSGEIIHAEYAETGGMDALEKIVQNRVGKFNFSPKLPDDAAKMKPLGNFMGILMNCLKDMDEKMSEDDNDEV
jgi:CRP-like cAMP-binding protein